METVVNCWYKTGAIKANDKKRKKGELWFFYILEADLNWNEYTNQSKNSNLKNWSS